jgi:hypothetical protein
MIHAEKLKIVTDLIESKRIKTFSTLFFYITKTELAKEIGVNYGRFLDLIEDPRRMRYEESASIANIFGVSHYQISELIINQLEEMKLSPSKSK